MPPSPAVAALLVVAPLAWSMRNENTALVKSLAIGIFAAAALAGTGPAGLWRRFRIAVPAHALVGLTLAGAIASPSPSFSWPPALLAVTLWLVAAAAAAAVRPDGWRRAFLLAAVVPLALGLLQALHLDPTGWAPLVAEHFHGRICSTLGNPNFLAGFLAAVLPFLWWTTSPHEGRGPLRRGAAVGLAGLGMVELFLTGSKGGLLGLAGATGATVLALRRADVLSATSLRHRSTALRIAIPVFAALAVILMPTEVRRRLIPALNSPAGVAADLGRNESVRFRALTWVQSLRMAREAPVLGLGPGRYQVVYPRFRLPEIIRMFGQHSYMTDHPENLTLEIAVELGLVGLGLWLWLLGTAARRLWLRLRDPATGERRLAAAALAGLAGLFLTNSFGVDIHYGATAALGAVLLGIAFRPRNAPMAAEPTASWVGVALALLLGLGWTRVYASDAALARALAFSGDAQWEPALGFYTEALGCSPANVMARYFSASALLDRGRPEDLPEAERRLDRVAHEAPAYVLVNYKFWMLYNRTGRPGLAQDALARQIALDPLAATFYLERGRLAVDQRRWEDARADFETATRVEPANPTGFQYLGNLEVTRGRYREALSVYHDGLVAHPDSLELRFNAAVAAWKAGRPAAARDFARAVLARDPNHAGARAILARVGR